MAKGKYSNRDKSAEDAAAQTAQPQAEKAEKETTTWVSDVGDAPKEGAAKLAELDFKDQAAREAAGQEEKTYGIFGPLWRLVHWYDSKRVYHTVNKKKYLWLLVLTGWMGGHRYYEKRYVLGIIYTLLFWTGIPLAMCVIDAMIVIPIKPDENGNIQLR